MNLEPFRREDVDAIELPQIDVRPLMHKMVPLYCTGHAYTVRTDDRIIACGGIIPTEQGGHLWAVIARGAPMVLLHRLALRAFGIYRLPLSATVELGFMPGCRWLEMLGFEYEGIAPGYGHDGSDHYVYVRKA